MAAPRVVGPHEGQLAFLGGTSARFIIDGDDAENRLALVEHPCSLAPWPRQCTDIIVRTNTVSSLRGASERCSGTPWQMAIPGI